MVLPDDRTRRTRPDGPGTTPGREDQPTTGLDGSVAPTLAPTFLSDEVVAERFRIVRFIAAGGMGEVYEAEDRELREHVALKTVHPGVAQDEAALERFRREVLLSRRVTHPNVCRIFDVFRHRLPDNRLTGEAGHDVVFLTMELLAGRTLTERLRTGGPFSTEEALPLAEQMAGALGAAHQAGVTHRDFKSNNVVLEPERDGRVRAVVTDFGLADAASEGEAQPESRDVVGTPAYMAPEQVEGHAIGPPADIYALGVVLYEMTTGRLPFIALTAGAMATMRLRQAPTSPRTHRPDLDPVWEQTILRCLERDPHKRFASAEAVARTLRAGKARRPPRRFALGAFAAGVLALLLTAGLQYWLTHRPGLRVGLLQSVQVTSSTGLDLFPAISPDGQRLAYSSDRTGRFELWLRGLALGSQDQQLTSDGGQNFQPSWSPDGKQLVYHSKVNGGLWLVPVSGGAPRRLTTFGSRPAWSPHGNWIAFQSDGLTDLAANALPAMPPSALWRVRPTGGEPLAITSPGDPPGGHGDPEWSPDETRLIFTVSDRRESSVWSASVEGKDPVRLSLPKTTAYDPVYAPDGRRAYFSGRSENFSFALWVLALDRAGHAQGAPLQLADIGPGASRHLSLSRDGTVMAFSAQRMSSNLWSLPMRGAQPTGEPQPLSSDTGRNSRPTISPDGSRVAFERWQAGARPDVWVRGTDGTGALQVTTDPGEDGVPNWDPSGERLVYRSEKDGRPAMRSLRLSDRREERVAEVEPDMDWVRLSPDGRSLVYQRPQGGSVNLWRMELPAGRPRQITFDPEFAGFACWSPDGQWLAMQVKRGEDFQIGVVPSGGGAPVALTSAEGQSWAYSWSPDGQRVAFAGFRAGFWNIYWISRSTREERTLTSYAKLNAYVRYPAWSPRGDRIVYEYAETTGNVWLLKGLN